MSLSIAERWSNRSPLIEHGLPPVISLLLATLVVSTASTLTMQAEFLDPYVYAGYVNDYFGTFQRYGHTYYSSRIAYIFLDKAFISLFGQTWGILLCRVLVLGCATYAAFSIAKRFFGWAAAVIVVSWLCFIPWLLRSIAWTHYDGFATAYLLIALALLLVPKTNRSVSNTAAGFFLALAVNCNLHIVMVAGLFAPSWLWLNRHERGLRLTGLMLSIIVGFLLGYLFLQILFSLAIANYRIFIEAAALNSARSLLAGQLANWFHPFSSLIQNGIFTFIVPIFFCGAGFVTLAANWKETDDDSCDFMIAAAVYCLLLTLAVFYLHYFVRHTWFSVFYYNIYFLPACLLVLVATAGATVRRVPWIARLIGAMSAIALLALWFSHEKIDTVIGNNLLNWVYFGAAVAIVALLKPKLTAAPVLTIGLICTTYGIFQMQSGVVSQYMIWPGHNNRIQADVYRGALFLQNFVRKNVPRNASVGFWYSNAPKNVNFNSMQSMFLWAYSRLQNHTGPGMPEIDDYFVPLVKQKEFIVLIARNDEEIDQALKALANVPIRHHEITRDSYTSSTESYRLALAELRPIVSSLGAPERRIDLSGVDPQNGSSLRKTNVGVVIQTTSCVWCYSATIALPNVDPTSKRDSTIRFSITVSTGLLGLATASKANISKLSNLVTMTPKQSDQVIDIKIKDSSEEDLIIFRNENSAGNTQFSIHSIEIFPANQQ